MIKARPQKMYFQYESVVYYLWSSFLAGLYNHTLKKAHSLWDNVLGVDGRYGIATIQNSPLKFLLRPVYTFQFITDSTIQYI